MKLVHQVTSVLVLSLLLPGAANAQLVPPQQDHFLHFWQRPEGALGVDQFAYVDTPGNLIVSNALTVEAWVFWEGTDWQELQAATGADLDFMTLLCGQRAYAFQYRSTNPVDHPTPEGWTFFLQTDTQTVSDTGLIPLPLNQWAHLAATYDGTAVRVFLNGVQQAAVAATGNIPVLGDFSHECVGNDSGTAIFKVGLMSGFNGGMRQLRIWNIALSGAEILANADQHLTGTETGLVGYWPLDEPLDPAQAPNIVAAGPPYDLLITTKNPSGA